MKDAYRGTTNSGFRFTIRKDTLNDMEFIESLMSLESDYNVPQFLAKLLGERQKKALYDHVRTERGTVPADRIREELTGIFNAIGALKN